MKVSSCFLDICSPAVSLPGLDFHLGISSDKDISALGLVLTLMASLIVIASLKATFFNSGFLEFSFFSFIFVTRSHYVAMAGLKFAVS